MTNPSPVKLNKTLVGLLVSLVLNVLGVTGVIPPAVEPEPLCPPGTPPPSSAPAPSH